MWLAGGTAAAFGAHGLVQIGRHMAARKSAGGDDGGAESEAGA
jgi:hypothetical protein